MLSRRYQIGLFFSVLAVVGIYLILPLTASYFLAQGLRQDGYKHVMIQLGYPRWDGMHIPVVAFQQNIGGERGPYQEAKPKQPAGPVGTRSPPQ